MFLFLLYCCFVTLFQKLNVTVSHHYGNGRLYINTTLTISAVSWNHSGTFICTGFNDAGVAIATAHLRVVGKCFLVHLFIGLFVKDNAMDIRVCVRFPVLF